MSFFLFSVFLLPHLFSYRLNSMSPFPLEFEYNCGVPVLKALILAKSVYTLVFFSCETVPQGWSALSTILPLVDMVPR